MAQYRILDDRAVVEIKGKDSFNFLQSLTTNDLKLLESQNSIYTLFLNPQGRFLFDAFIIKIGEKFLLDINKQNSANFIQKLNFYKLRSDVKIEIKEEFKVIYTRKELIGEICFKDNRYALMGYRSFYNKEEILGTLAPDLYLEDKYQYSIPDGFIDFLYEKTLPPEYNADKLNAISYIKGCYTGQEVISRTKYQGEIRKQLYKFTFNEDAKIDLSIKEIYQGPNKIGALTSYWKNLGIALLRKELVDLEQKITIAGIDARLSVPKWLKK